MFPHLRKRRAKYASLFVKLTAQILNSFQKMSLCSEFEAFRENYELESSWLNLYIFIIQSKKKWIKGCCIQNHCCHKFFFFLTLRFAFDSTVIKNKEKTKTILSFVVRFIGYADFILFSKEFFSYFRSAKIQNYIDFQ